LGLAYSLPLKSEIAEILALKVFWANFRFLRVAATERFFKVMLLRPKGSSFMA
jgi:hypothetical protein